MQDVQDVDLSMGNGELVTVLRVEEAFVQQERKDKKNGLGVKSFVGVNLPDFSLRGVYHIPLC